MMTPDEDDDRTAALAIDEAERLAITPTWFNIINKETGELLPRHGTAPFRDINSQPVADNEAVVMLGDHITAATHVLDISTGDIVSRELDIVAEAKKGKLREIALQLELSGRKAFVSSALGVAARYRADRQALVEVALVGGALFCMADQTWGMVQHTPEQGVGVLRDFVKAREALHVQHAALVDTLKSAVTPEDVDAVSLKM